MASSASAMFTARTRSRALYRSLSFGGEFGRGWHPRPEIEAANLGWRNIHIVGTGVKLSTLRNP